MSVDTWKAVVGWEGAYRVSSAGRVQNVRTGHVLKWRMNPKGYACVRLMAGARDEDRTVHALVAAAFIGPRPRGLQINHINGDKSDNAHTNLEYVTCAANIAHAIREGLRAPIVYGEDASRSKLTDADVRDIRRMCRAGESQSAVAQMFHITQANVSSIVTRKTWGHLR